MDRFEAARQAERFLDGDLAFALHETAGTLGRAAAAATDVPESAEMIEAVRAAIERRLAEVLEDADPVIREQLRVIATA